MALNKGNDVFSEFGLRMKEFTITSYHNLPNTLFVASALLGSIQGNTALVWVALGFILNGLTTAGAQEILGLVFPKWNQVHQATSAACTVIPSADLNTSTTTIVAPSHWFSATTYFVVFVLYNAIQLVIRPSAPGADNKKVDIRVALSASVITSTIFFLALILMRGLTGCETWLGSILGVLFGAGVAIGYWHILDVCGTGVPPDIMGVVSAMAPPPDANADANPVICTN